jgi:thiol-disulfide isomerase/thioredoxin
VTTSSRRNSGGSKSPAPKRLPVLPIVVGGIAILLILAVVLTRGGGSSDGDGTVGETASVDITGDELARLDDPAIDPTIGSQAPSVSGIDFAGNTVAITNDGRAKMIMFVAHWCGVCQDEVPEVVGWLAGDPLPQDVDLYLISTGVDDTRPNYPPSEWLADEGWNAPTIVDSEFGEAATAFGLPAYPYWVFVASDGTVAGRVTGGLEVDVLDALAVNLAEL